MPAPPLQIIVDDREARSSRVIEFLAEETEVQISRKRLRSGDYLVEGRIIAERKRIPDFLASLCDGRLFSQASALASCGLRGILILEGQGSDWILTGVNRAAIQGAMLTLGVVFDLQILRSRDEAETAHLLLFTARQIRQRAQVTIRRPGWRPKGKRARQLYILTSLPGVGATRARALLKHFGSVERVISASEAELLTVDGIGPRTATAIQEAVHETTTPYQAEAPALNRSAPASSGQVHGILP